MCKPTRTQCRRFPIQGIGVICCLVFCCFATYASTPTPRPPGRVRSFEQAFGVDIRSATPDQALTPSLEQKAEAEADYMEGVALEDEGDLEGAFDAYNNALRLDPGGDPALAVRMANEYAKREDVPTGINILKDLAKARPDDADAFIGLADFYFDLLKKPALAVGYAEQALRLSGTNLDVYESLFNIYVALHRRRDAEALLQRAQKIDGQTATFWLTLADLSIRLYSNEKTGFEAARATAVTPFLKKAGDLANDDPDIISKIGDAYVEINDVSAAIPYYLQAIELNKGNPETLYKLAQSFLKTGHRNDAIHALEELVQANPLRLEAYEFLARLYQDGGNREQALASYQQAILIAPNDPENYLHAAEMQLELHKFDDAIAMLQDARRRFSIPQITYALAISLSSAKRYSESLPIFEAALQEAKALNQTDVLDAGFYFNYGAAAEQSNLVDKAATLLRRSIDLDPSKAAQAYNYLGYMWVDRNMNLEEGGSMIKRALEIEPNNGAYLDSLGWYYYRTGDFPHAVTALLRAVSLTKPEDPVVFEHTGDAYHALGNLGQAQLYWQKALHLDPSNQELGTKLEQSKTKLSSNPSPTPSPEKTDGN
ncbi:MAG: tetratricopeptide repeat protein [Verrucomicrobia bacterium]|nr:tetratricopeptide repeat protein [Verrucomicrobiota bacterium]